MELSPAPGSWRRQSDCRFVKRHHHTPTQPTQLIHIILILIHITSLISYHPLSGLYDHIGSNRRSTSQSINKKLWVELLCVWDKYSRKQDVVKQTETRPNWNSACLLGEDDTWRRWELVHPPVQMRKKVESAPHSVPLKHPLQLQSRVGLYVPPLLTLLTLLKLLLIPSRSLAGTRFYYIMTLYVGPV